MINVLTDLLEYNAVHYGDKVAVIDNDSAYTYREIFEMVVRLSSYLKDKSVNRYDRIGIVMHNCIEHIVSIFAIARVGAIFVSIHPGLTKHQVIYITENCSLKYLITSKNDKPRCLDGIPESGILEFEDSGSTVIPGLTTSDVCITDRDVASIIYTSGSTGKPKGIMITHGNLIAGTKSVSSYLSLSDRDRVLSILPFNFDYGLNQLLTCFYVNATLIIKYPFTMYEIPYLLHHYEITGLAGIPAIWTQIVQQRNIRNYNYDKLRYITNSGGSLSSETIDLLSSIFSQTDIYLMYGLTEAFRSTYLDPKEFLRKKGSIGKSIPNAEVMVINEEGCLCKPYEIGELVTRGAMVTLGYWGDRDATEKVYRPNPIMPPEIGEKDIVVFSGDLGYYDEEGFLYFVGRKNLMIKRKGYRISPSEIEEVLYKIKGIEECAVFGIKDETEEEMIVACIQLSEKDIDKELLYSNINRTCIEYLPSYMHPDRIFLLDEFPRTASGKIDIPKLKAMYEGKSSDK